MKFSIIFTGLLFTIFSSGQNNINKPRKYKSKAETFVINTFSNFPAEIDGCSCYFSNNSNEFKKNIYIYVNDFAQISFLKINNEIVKFIQTEFKNVSKSKIISKSHSDKYDLKLEVSDGKNSGEEVTIKTGKITITSKNGQVVTKTFYGECGC